VYPIERKLRALLAIALLAAFPLAAPAANRPTLAPYELNAIIPLTGGGAFLGKDYVDVFRAVELLVNSSGGIQGHPLKFVTADTESNGQVDVQLVNGLISKRVPVFIDGAPSSVCSPSIPLVEKNGPVDYCLSPAIHPALGGYVFSVNASTFDLASVSLRYFRERGWKRVATLTSTDASGQDYDRTIPAVLALPENHDLQLVAREHFNTSDISVAAQIARIKSANPQILLALTTGTSLGTVLRALRDAGLNVPVSTNSPNMTYAQMSAYAASLPKELYFPTLRAMTPNETLLGPLHDAQTVYLKAFRAIGVKPDGGHANAWDATMIIVAALRHIGPSATAQQIRDYILHLHGWVGANGVYDFSNSTSGIGQNSAIVARWVPEKGTWVQSSRPRGLLK
jgi:branched-chain amino acid transport system substrate-binding protein